MLLNDFKKKLVQVFSIPRTVIVACLSWILVIVLSIYSFDGTTANAVYSRSAALCMVIHIQISKIDRYMRVIHYPVPTHLHSVEVDLF